VRSLAQVDWMDRSTRAERRFIGMDSGERTTGTHDKHLAAFFREAQGIQTQLAERAKGLLSILEPSRG
jgi:hypothetical protein